MNPDNPDQPLRSAIFTDLYELSMAQAYYKENINEIAVFEMYFREFPPCRKYLIAAGLEDVMQYLINFHFSDDDLDFLRQQKQFNETFITKLGSLSFTGDVLAVPEGTAIFPNEPVIQIIAPVIEAQLIETLVLNQIHFQTLVASKAARIITAAQDKPVVDFGSRRAHGADAALKSARAAYLVGGAGTSNVLAGKQYGIPILGTMAHSYIQAHEDESAALKAFAAIYPETTLLVDTYDTLEGVRKVISICQSNPDLTPGAIRLDSGDLAELSKQSRKLLDEAGLNHIKIMASGGLDEYKIKALLETGAPLDGFGVGTRLAISEDAPAIDCAYKLVEFADKPKTKLSSQKRLYPGRKQVYRQQQDGVFSGDIIARHDETADGEPLLQPVIRQGKRLNEARFNIENYRDIALENLSHLPALLKHLDPAASPYPVRFSDRLQQDFVALQQKLSK